MPGPITTGVTGTTATGAARRNPLFFLLSLGAMAVAGQLVKDTYDGRKEEVKRLVDNHHLYVSEQYMRSGWGHWSGQPAMDSRTHNFKYFLMVGPLHLRAKYYDYRIRFDNLVNNVILPNLLPIGAAVASLYLAVGKETLHKPIRNFAGLMRRCFGHLSGRIPVGPTLHNKVLKPAGRGIEKGFIAFANSPNKPGILGLGLVGTALGAFFLKRFQESYGHEGTHNFFMKDIYGNSNH